MAVTLLDPNTVLQHIIGCLKQGVRDDAMA